MMEIKTYYHPNGQIRIKYNHIDGKRHGLYESWHQNGQIDEISNYVNDKLHGLCELWYENGQIWIREHWKDGKRYGLCEEWYQNGQIINVKYYINNKPYVVRLSGIKKTQRRIRWKFQKNRLLVLYRKLPMDLVKIILGFI